MTQNSAKTFALVGIAGYVAPRHLAAIKANDGILAAAFDPADSVGVIDRYFPDARFFVEFERFDRHIDKLLRRGNPIHYLSICSPNYLHDAHVRFGLRSGANVICEKPLVLNPWNLDGIAEMEVKTGCRVSTILQLRLHPSVLALQQEVMQSKPGKVFDVDLTYIAARGSWYHVSWKGDEAKSGGIATNIGVHFFDMLGFVFGPLESSVVHHRAPERAAGYLKFRKARVRWYLSIDREDLPHGLAPDQTTFRQIMVDGREFELSRDFTDLHTQCYREILAQRGFTIEDVRPSIELVSHFRSAPIEPERETPHPFLRETPQTIQGYRHGRQA